MDQGISKTAKEYAREAYEEELELLRRLAKIPAPSGKEGKRAAFVKEWLREAGADSAFIDPAGNVICRLEGKDRNTASVFSAHMDVVAESVKECWDHRASVKGLEMVYEPRYLRFFQARFEPKV